jgi:hypothetical protein
MIDPTGRIISELRADATVAALTNDRIRGGAPMAGDALGPGQYQRFVVVVRLGRSRGAPGGGANRRRFPMQEVRLAARCYGAGGEPMRDAAALAGAVSDALHAKGPRISAGGVGIWLSLDDGSEGDAKDPTTDQPYETVLISVHAADRVIA